MANKLSKQDNIRVLKRLTKYIKHYMPALIFSLIAALSSALIALYIPVLIGKSVDLISLKDGPDTDGIVVYLVQMIYLICITTVIKWLMNIINNRMTAGIVKNIRQDAFERLQTAPINELDSRSGGDIVSRVISDVNTFSEGLLMGFNQLFTGVVTILGTLFFMVKINLIISVVVVVATPLSVIIAGFIAKKIHVYFVKQAEIKGKTTELIDESIDSVKVIKVFNHEDKTIERFDKQNEELGKISLKAVFFSSLVNPTTRFVNNLIYALVALTGAFMAGNGIITIGDLTCLLSYSNQYSKPFNEISGVVTELQNAICCLERIFEIIDIEPEIDSNSNMGIAEGNVAFENVSFSYDKNKPLIENMNISVNKGMRVAIVGPTGCGKTTLINLIMRFYDVDSGRITVDGSDIATVSKDSLRSNIGMVLQNTFIFEGSVRDNIAMVKKDATLEEIMQAAKTANAHSFIMRLPNGYDTCIGEETGGLSEGQRQLICIARVMLLRPPMLILDEATSSIDTRTEIKIQKAFANLSKDKTSFIVAHRLQTIKEADIILVMKDGKLIEQGNHEELMNKNGFYRELYMSQES